MPTFHPPVYSKQTNPKNNAVEPCYTFSIEFAQDESCYSFVADSVEDITANGIASLMAGTADVWTQFVKQFMQASSKMFAKPYTVDQINKITRHGVKELSYTGPFPATVVVLPTTIKIQGGIFWVDWEYRFTPIVIDIPVLLEADDTTASITLPDQEQEQVNGELVEELNLDELNMDGNATDDLELSHSDRFYDKRRVKEARLKAKLAQYKAEIQMRMYYDKYGNDISDTDADSDVSYTSSDEEEVQL
jgi:hypothetical protein